MCNIEEVPSFRYNGKLYNTRSAAVAAGLGEIADDIKRNFAHGPLDGLVKHSAALIFLLAEYRKDAEADAPAREKDPKPEAVLDWRALDHQGHAPSCLARATGYASKCNCDARTDDADGYSGPDVTRSGRLEL